MLVLVGLGNPGPEYARNRHNIGFLAIDEIAARYNFPDFRSRFQGLVSEGLINNEKIMLLKPMTYMNRSGQSVGEALRYYKLAPADLVVLHDEIDLAFGKLKIKRGGGSAGHNGIRDIDAHLADPGYRRVRLGVGHPGGKTEVKKHVLSDFSKADMSFVAPWMAAIADNIPAIVAGDDARFLNDLALALRTDDSHAAGPGATKPKSAAPNDAKGGSKQDAPNPTPNADAAAPKTGLAAAFEAALSRFGGKTGSDT